MRSRLFSSLACCLMLLGLAIPVLAAPPLQPTAFPTPTPGPDGRIIYIVQPGDTLWRIAAMANISIDQLRALNNLTASDVIAPGDEIFLGLGGPATAIPPEQPTATPAPSGPTPTTEIGYGVICVILYNDANGDAIRQEEESFIPAGRISIAHADGSMSVTEDTLTGLDHLCTENLEEGEYNISVGIPDGYNSTTAISASIVLNGGDEIYLDFGAQPNSETLAEAPAPVGTGRSPLLGIIGGFVLLVGIGLGVYAAVMRK
ncbi:MAG: LysM peptidoglycan-binding domain-containing protein [Chloroflexi bacterium]|nr:LysM peptidoglycan-binding domain-containing protein [Chloroflexota bacterium]